MIYAISFIPTEDTLCQCRVLKGLGLLWINSLFCHYNCTCILNYPKCGPSFHQPVNCALIKTDRHIICMNTLKHWQLRPTIAGNLKSCNWITFEPSLVAGMQSLPNFSGKACTIILFYFNLAKSHSQNFQFSPIGRTGNYGDYI